MITDVQLIHTMIKLHYVLVNSALVAMFYINISKPIKINTVFEHLQIAAAAAAGHSSNNMYTTAW